MADFNRIVRAHPGKVRQETVAGGPTSIGNPALRQALQPPFSSTSIRWQQRFAQRLGILQQVRRQVDRAGQMTEREFGFSARIDCHEAGLVQPIVQLRR